MDKVGTKGQMGVLRFPNPKRRSGITNMSDMANKLAAKWIIRSVLAPNEKWSWLIHGNKQEFALKDHPKWKSLLAIIVFASKYQVKPKAAP